MDDGPAGMADSLKIAETASKEGVTVIFATPHYGNGIHDTSLEPIQSACAALNAELKRRRMNLIVYSGAEVRINSEILHELSTGKVITLGGMGNAVLLEMPSVFILEGIEMIVRQMLDNGIIPIIAHPERNPEILKQPHILARLVRMGAMMQITAGSVVGDYGKISEKCALDMLCNDLVHFVGSDMHPGRKYRMAKFKKKAMKLLSAEKVESIVRGSALNLIFERKMCQNFN